MNIPPLVVKPWVKEVVDAMAEYHGKDNIDMDLFSYYFRIWKDGEVYAYVRKNSGNVYRPCTQKNRRGAHKFGTRAGVLFDLSDDNERKECIEKVKETGKIYGPIIHRNSEGSHKYEGKLTEDEMALLGHS